MIRLSLFCCVAALLTMAAGSAMPSVTSIPGPIPNPWDPAAQISSIPGPIPNPWDPASIPGPIPNPWDPA
jgi:hypothetical protein